jgi:hypothetical protein
MVPGILNFRMKATPKLQELLVKNERPKRQETIERW